MHENIHGQTYNKEMPEGGSTVFSAWVSSSHRVPVVTIRGEIDLATVPQLLEAVDIAGSRLDGRPLLVVDLRETDFIDVAGVRKLVEEARTMREIGGDLRVVVSRKGPVARVFELLGVDRTLDLHHGLDLRLSIDEQAS